MPAPDLDQVMARGLNHTLGFRLGEATAERVEMGWTVGEEHLQPYGIVHGGVHCSVVEASASIGAALWAAENLGPDTRVVGVSNHTDFLRAARDGTLTAVATPVHCGRSQQLWLVEVSDEQSRAIARGQVRLQNLPPRG